MEQFKNIVVEFFKNTGANILEAIALLLVGIIAIKLIVIIVRRLMNRTKIEGTATSFIISIIKAVLWLWLFFLILSKFNVDTSSLVAILAASGLAIGLALQDSLSNIASGIILLFTKPFKENDYVSVGGTEGVVKKIKITTTELLTTDNIQISVPNKMVVSSEIKNFSNRKSRRMDVVVSAAYEADMDAVKAALYKIVAADDRILKTPFPEVFVCQLDSRSVNYKVRLWTNNDNYWPIYNGFLEKVFKQFKAENIEIPYNKLNVKLIKEDK